ncbi:MAG: phosphatidylglycerol lysyltransferase domain-containing protein [Vagococcus sp.]|uniref:phosphatidylglycerol lysyltransferase domain-containing protein n=1 Tax=Vagococcus TaxID=2737 RepID=UPI002FC7A9E4
MKKFFKIAIAAIIFLFSMFKLKAELSSINFKDIFTVIQERSLLSIATLIFVSFLSIWVLSLYDLVLVRSQKLKVPLLKTIKMSWIINSLNALLGFGGIIGSTIRYNYFSAFTSSKDEKNQLKKSISLLLVSMLTGIGVLSIAVLFNFFHPIPLLNQKPFLKTGLLVLGIAVPLFLITTTIKPPISHDRFLSLKYTLVSVLDYVSVSLVMFLSLRFVDVDVNFWQMEIIFIIASLAGLISMVPGGLGAFDVIFLLGMTQQFHVSEGPILLSLVFYRLTYYILPFILGLILSVTELQVMTDTKSKDQEPKEVKEISLFTKEFGTIVVDVTKKRIQVLIRWVIIILFLIGNVFFFQDAFLGIFAIPSSETNFFICLFASIYLLASLYLIPNYIGLYHGSKEAMTNTAILLVLIVMSQIVLFNQLYFIEGFIFSLMLLIVLYLGRKSFPLQLTTPSRKEKGTWLITLVITISTLLTILDIADSLELPVYSGFYYYVLCLSLLWFLFISIKRYRLRSIHKFSAFALENDMNDSKETYKEIITTHTGNNLAHLGFLPANTVLNDTNLEVSCIYQENRTTILILGDPVGNQSQFIPFINNLHDYASQIGKELIFYQTSTDFIHIYTQLNYNLFNLGEEAEVDVTTFKITGNKGKVFRQLINKQENEEITFQVEESTPELINELQVISDAWLGDKKEMSFSLGDFNPTYLSQNAIATLRNNNGEAIAFASIMPTYVDNKISVDLIRWLDNPNIPMMDLLYLNLILWSKENDYTIFNLGMAPLSSSYNKSNDFLDTIVTSIYQNSSSLYSFKGLRQYKNKFKPNWYPRYLIYPKKLSVYQALLTSYRNIHPHRKK